MRGKCLSSDLPSALFATWHIHECLLSMERSERLILSKSLVIRGERESHFLSELDKQPFFLVPLFLSVNDPQSLTNLPSFGRSTCRRSRWPSGRTRCRAWGGRRFGSSCPGWRVGGCPLVRCASWAGIGAGKSRERHPAPARRTRVVFALLKRR